MSEKTTEQNTAESERSPIPGSNRRLSVIRIILIGGRDSWICNDIMIEASGKSSTGNIILGRDAFVVGRRTARSVQATGEVHGRHVTVVDTPGWLWFYPVKNTPNFDRLEIMRSLTLCPPGPHVFLLVIRVDCKFRKEDKMALEEHLEFWTQNVWSHIIVVFSSSSPCNRTTFKKHCRKYPGLQWLLRKCQNRYHILNINNRDGSSQVITLLDKIEELVAQNNGQFYKISVFVKKEMEKITKERAKQRIHAVKSKRSELQAHTKDVEQHLTHIRIVMMGGSLSFKSSAGNTILGEEAFEVSRAKTTVRCAVSHAKAHGKQLTVVDTPGWYCHSPLETPEIDKLEIRRSVYLCSPGPHAILLTVPIATAFHKSYQIAVEEHMSLLGKEVWRHTIVLFTRGDWLGDTTIEERIEKEGEHLEWLMEQCGNRYHVINCKNPTDTSQVTELFDKIEEMVVENNSSYYEPEIKSDPSIELELKMKTAKINKIKVSKQRYILQEILKEKKYNHSEVRIVLLGAEGAGKSTSGNIILQRRLFEQKLLESFKIQTKTGKCEMKQRKVDGIKISVVDTPGWSTSNLENAREIFHSVSVCSPGPHAFLLVLPAHESFTQKTQQSVEELMGIFGENVWRHTIILFFGHWLKYRPTEKYIECEGEALQELIRKCGNRYHVLVDDYSNRSQVRNLLKMIKVMVAKNRGDHFTLEKKEKMATTTVFQCTCGSKTLTEEEWNKREDELIERMLEAVIVDMDAEFKQTSRKRGGSIDYPIPSMSGESIPDNTSLFKADVLNPAVRVSQWLWNPRNYAASSGYDTISITSGPKHPRLESLIEDEGES